MLPPVYVTVALLLIVKPRSTAMFVPDIPKFTNPLLTTRARLLLLVLALPLPNVNVPVPFIVSKLLLAELAIITRCNAKSPVPLTLKDALFTISELIV